MSEGRNRASSWIPTNPMYDANKPMQIGGQAVIEGVMMRAPGVVATAVRRANGTIVVSRQQFVPLAERFKVLSLPVLRGAVGLLEMMYLGIKTLNWSAEVAMMDTPAGSQHNGSGNRIRSERKPSTLTLVVTLVLALTVGIAVFFVVPLVITTQVFAVEQRAFAFNVVSGSIRILILLLYLGGISMMGEIRRLFRYHGAEHKTVFAFELSDHLDAPHVQKHSRFHPRCGTSFLLVVMFVAILSFALLDTLLLHLVGGVTLTLRLVTHLPFIPVVGGLAYELIKFSARHGSTWWGRMLVAPGLWLQSLTTKEPDDGQVDVAVVALKSALGLEDIRAVLWEPAREQSEAAKMR